MPTPMAPPKTDSAVRSMPTADSASINPTDSNNARVALLATLRSDSDSPLASRSSRASMADDTHNATISTTAADSAPSSSVRTDTVLPPSFQWIWSSSASTTGSNPVIQATAASHASHDSDRSTGRSQGASRNATSSTLTPTRIATSAISAGMATLHTARGTHIAVSVRPA